MSDARTTGRTRKRSRDGGFTLLEVMVAFVILTASAVPLLIALADSQRRVYDSQVKRTMKQLLEYKLANVLLDRPGAEKEPIYVDGAEGNFGDEFAGLQDKSYWFGEELYYYSYRIDSQEIDLGLQGGITGEEEESAAPPENDPSGDPLGGLGEGEAAEDLGQLRYLVTLTVTYFPGNANFTQHMTTVAYVKHPHQSEAMSGPDLTGAGGAGGPLGAGEAGAPPPGSAPQPTSGAGAGALGIGRGNDGGGR